MPTPIYSTHQATCIYQHQCGMVMIVSLVFLLVMTMLGITAMQGTTQQERMSSNISQRILAFQSAEAGLRTAETCVRELTVPPTTRTACTDLTSAAITGATISDTANEGVHLALSPNTDFVTYWTSTSNQAPCTTNCFYDWTGGAGPNSGSIVAGTLDSNLSSAPRYVVERLQTTVITTGSVSGGDISTGKSQAATTTNTFLYRLTARGTGGTADAVAIVQSLYIPNVATP